MLCRESSALTTGRTSCFIEEEDKTPEDESVLGHGLCVPGPQVSVSELVYDTRHQSRCPCHRAPPRASDAPGEPLTNLLSHCFKHENLLSTWRGGPHGAECWGVGLGLLGLCLT